MKGQTRRVRWDRNKGGDEGATAAGGEGGERRGGRVASCGGKNPSPLPSPPSFPPLSLPSLSHGRQKDPRLATNTIQVVCRGAIEVKIGQATV